MDQIPGQMTIDEAIAEEEARRRVIEEAVSDFHRFNWWPIEGCSCDDCRPALELNERRRRGSV